MPSTDVSMNFNALHLPEALHTVDREHEEEYVQEAVPQDQAHCGEHSQVMRELRRREAGPLFCFDVQSQP